MSAETKDSSVLNGWTPNSSNEVVGLTIHVLINLDAFPAKVTHDLSALWFWQRLKSSYHNCLNDCCHSTTIEGTAMGFSFRSWIALGKARKQQLHDKDRDIETYKCKIAYLEKTIEEMKKLHVETSHRNELNKQEKVDRCNKIGASKTKTVRFEAQTAEDAKDTFSDMTVITPKAQA